MRSFPQRHASNARAVTEILRPRAAAADRTSGVHLRLVSHGVNGEAADRRDGGGTLAAPRVHSERALLARGGAMHAMVALTRPMWSV